MSFNKIILVGNLGRDPELRYTPQGDAVCTFSMATNQKRKDAAGNPTDVATWFKITLWRRQAENAAKYLTKGSPVYIEGRLAVEEWTDRENKERYSLVVQASEMQFIGSGNRDDDHAGGGYSQPSQPSFPTHAGPPADPPPAATYPTTTAVTNAGDDDIPF